MEVSGLEPQYLTAITRALTLSNPQYYKLRRKGKKAYGVPEDIRYYHYDSESDSLKVPRGFEDRLVAGLERGGYTITVTDQTVATPLVETPQLVEDAELRWYQKEMVAQAKEEAVGMFVAGTGTGKTLTGLAIIASLGLKATILVPKTSILTQWKDEAKRWYGLELGEVSGKKKEVKDITVATFQSLFNDSDVRRNLINQTSVLIVDECHGAVSLRRREVLSAFRPRRLYGITALPDRSDGQADAIDFHFGRTLFSHEGTRLNPIVDCLNTRGNTPLIEPYNEMIDHMVDDESRNTLIAGLVLGEILEGRKVLCLTKRVKHYENIKKKLGDWDGVHFLSSGDPAKDELLVEFKNGREFKALFGTTSLLSEGTDVPALETLILACDMKSRVLTTQSVGRVLRENEGKNQPKIIDLCDYDNEILKRQAWARRKVYEENNWQIL